MKTGIVLLCSIILAGCFLDGDPNPTAQRPKNKVIGTYERSSCGSRAGGPTVCGGESLLLLKDSIIITEYWNNPHGGTVVTSRHQFSIENIYDDKLFLLSEHLSSDGIPVDLENGILIDSISSQGIHLSKLSIYRGSTDSLQGLWVNRSGLMDTLDFKIDTVIEFINSNTPLRCLYEVLSDSIHFDSIPEFQYENNKCYSGTIYFAIHNARLFLHGYGSNNWYGSDWFIKK